MGTGWGGGGGYQDGEGVVGTRIRRGVPGWGGGWWVAGWGGGGGYQDKEGGTRMGRRVGTRMGRRRWVPGWGGGRWIGWGGGWWVPGGEGVVGSRMGRRWWVAGWGWDGGWCVEGEGYIQVFKQYATDTKYDTYKYC